MMWKDCSKATCRGKLPPATATFARFPTISHTLAATNTDTFKHGLSTTKAFSKHVVGLMQLHPSQRFGVLCIHRETIVAGCLSASRAQTESDVVVAVSKSSQRLRVRL